MPRALSPILAGALAALIILCGLVVASTGCQMDTSTSPQTTPQVIVVQPLWFEGIGDEDRPTLDRFLECLIHGSDFQTWWDGAVDLRLRPSVTLPAPDSMIEVDDVPVWIEEHLADAGIEVPEPADVTMQFLAFSGWPMTRLTPCGRNSEFEIDGKLALMALVRISPHCWNTEDSVRGPTQVATHEILEGIDGLLGYTNCAGGGSCNGRRVCPDACDTFVGLQCPGAPTDTRTGCGDQRIDGWVIQSFSREQRADKALCETCTPCDFTPTVW